MLMVLLYFRANVTTKLPFSLPAQIVNLLVIETQNSHEGHHFMVFNNFNLVGKCENPNIAILCNDENSNYVIKWSPINGNTSGEVCNVTYYILIMTKLFQVVQLIEEWIKKATYVYSITISSIGLYRNYELPEKPPAIIRILTNDTMSWPYKNLEPPNLVSDLPANILSFCIHCNIKCSLFVIYSDLLPCDSLNTKSLVDILNQLNFPVTNLYSVKPLISSGNLFD